MKKYSCSDCGINTRKDKKDFYMVKNELWGKHGVGKEMLCLNCFEKRLGRKLQKPDIILSVLNLRDNPYTKNLLLNG